MLIDQLQKEINQKCDDYYRRHENRPKSISLGHKFYNILLGNKNCVPIFNLLGVIYFSYMGLPIKVVNKENYIECLPRFKKQKKSKGI